jgi:hypothetical protein
MIGFSKSFFYNLFNKNVERRKLLELVEKSSSCIEIGVWKGDFAERILTRIKPNKLILIDPWKFVSSHHNRWHGGKSAKNQKDMNDIYKKVKSRFDKYKNVKIVRSCSSLADKKLGSDIFDFVYIDGDHSYKHVLNDLIIYSNRLSPKGLLAGDDFFWGALSGFPVARAVLKFYFSNKMKLVITGRGYYYMKIPEKKTINYE